ncbi:MAG TPA: hypothetical protein VEF03_01545 [Candidatus Binataceae bacterium]|nr:hypothetical protein [Candidatus Binataceae bacterium]
MAAIPQEIAKPFIRKDGTAGPMTRARQRRTIRIYAVMCVLGILPFLMHASASSQAAGLGLWFPGAGFLAVGGWAMLLTPVTLALFALAVFTWFGAGMVIAPIIVWLGSALMAGSMAGDSIVGAAPWLVVAFTGGALGWAYNESEKRKRANLAKLDDRTRYLPAAIKEVIERAAPTPVPGERELSPEDLAAARYAFDRALQPVGQLNGFDKVDQFQTSALRYQINFIGYALGLLQCHYTPSFHGYLSQAQRNIIETYLQRQIWGYWVYESAWGHLNLTNPDPANWDNIMLTGWLGLHIGMYMSASGDRRYAEQGSLTFRMNRNRAFHHDIHSLERSVMQNFQNSQFCLYPCEPNWIYPICNHYGMTSLVLYDRLFGASHSTFVMNRWLDNLDREFTDDSGSLIGLRSGLTGLPFPFPAGEAGFADFTNCFAPDRAWRMWAIAHHDLQYIMKKDADGAASLSLSGAGFDFGNYRSGFVGAYATIMNGAREFGDDEVADAAQRALDRDCGRTDANGILRYARGSNLSNLMAFRARIHRRDDFRSAVTQGPPASVFKGPLLTGASYPDVLVAKAFSHGNDLDLVLYPGAAPGPQTIRIERLTPDARYTIENSQREPFVADRDGAASITVDLDGRTPLHIIPQA